jgi:hypothetical protein
VPFGAGDDCLLKRYEVNLEPYNEGRAIDCRKYYKSGSSPEKVFLVQCPKYANRVPIWNFSKRHLILPAMLGPGFRHSIFRSRAITRSPDLLRASVSPW